MKTSFNIFFSFEPVLVSTSRNAQEIDLPSWFEKKCIEQLWRNGRRHRFKKHQHALNKTTGKPVVEVQGTVYDLKKVASKIYQKINKSENVKVFTTKNNQKINKSENITVSQPKNTQKENESGNVTVLQQKKETVAAVDGWDPITGRRLGPKKISPARKLFLDLARRRKNWELCLEELKLVLDERNSKYYSLKLFDFLDFLEFVHWHRTAPKQNNRRRHRERREKLVDDVTGRPYRSAVPCSVKFNFRSEPRSTSILQPLSKITKRPESASIADLKLARANGLLGKLYLEIELLLTILGEFVAQIQKQREIPEPIVEPGKHICFMTFRNVS